MILYTKKKFKKFNKGSSTNRIKNQIGLEFLKKNTYILKSIDSGRILYSQLKSALQVVKKLLKRKGFINFSIFCNRTITKKPIEIRMGKGKGALFTSITRIFPGMVLIRIVCHNPTLAKKALSQAKKRLSINSQII